GTFFKILDRAGGLRMMARAGRQLAIVHRAQFAAHRLLGHDDPELFENPLAEIDDPPAHHPVNRRDRATLNDRRQRRTVLVVQARLRSRRLAIDQAVGTMRIELQRPVANDLQRHPADLRSLGARRAFVDRRQRQQPPRLRPVLRTLRRGPNRRSVIIGPKRYRHGEPPSFATLNQTAADSKSPVESCPAGLGIRLVGRPRLWSSASRTPPATPARSSNSSTS